MFQMLLGVALMALGVSCWAPNQQGPHRLVSGILLHAYGALMVISAGVTCTKIRRLDYSKSTDAVRDQLDRLRNHYLRWGGLLGFSWWLLWIPLAVALGFDAVMHPISLWPSICMGVIGLAASLILYARLIQSKNPVAERWTRVLAGESLTAANLALDEIASTEMM